MQDFEGPLDLILYLLGKNKMEIQDISISLICDQYMAWLARRQEMDLEVASEFVTMASQLVYIKTRMLLSIEDEEAQSEMDALIALSGGAAAQRELRQGEVHGRPAGAHGGIRTEYPDPSAGAGEAGKNLRVRPGHRRTWSWPWRRSRAGRSGPCRRPAPPSRASCSTSPIPWRARPGRFCSRLKDSRRHSVSAAVPGQPQPQRGGGHLSGGAGAVPGPTSCIWQGAETDCTVRQERELPEDLKL